MRSVRFAVVLAILSSPAPAARAADPPAPWLARQKGQGHAQAPSGDAHLVDGFLVAGQGPGQLLEDAADPLAEERRGAIDEGLRGGQAGPRRDLVAVT